MIRSAAATASALIFVCSLAGAPGAFAQSAKPATATPATGKPASAPLPAKWVTPIKGIANVEFIQTQPKKVGDEVVTTMKVRNMSDGAIALLKIDEYWYNKKREIVGSCTQRVKQPISPKQIVDVEIKCPYKGDIDQNQYMFSHANGQVKPKAVKKFSE
jgi:hypothetical protein